MNVLYFAYFPHVTRRFLKLVFLLLLPILAILRTLHTALFACLKHSWNYYVQERGDGYTFCVSCGPGSRGWNFLRQPWLPEGGRGSLQTSLIRAERRFGNSGALLPLIPPIPRG